MQFSTTALAALAAVTQLSGVAHAYTWDDNLGRPICEDVDGQGAVDFSNLDCGSSVAKLEACNNMCASQSRGCTWGTCFIKVLYTRSQCASAANAGYDDPELDFTCGQTASYIHACNQCHFTF